MSSITDALPYGAISRLRDSLGIDAANERVIPAREGATQRTAAGSGLTGVSHRDAIAHSIWRFNMEPNANRLTDWNWNEFFKIASNMVLIVTGNPTLAIMGLTRQLRDVDAVLREGGVFPEGDLGFERVAREVAAVFQEANLCVIS